MLGCRPSSRADSIFGTKYMFFSLTRCHLIPLVIAALCPNQTASDLVFLSADLQSASLLCLSSSGACKISIYISACFYFKKKTSVHALSLPSAIFSDDILRRHGLSQLIKTISNNNHSKANRPRWFLDESNQLLKQSNFFFEIK